MAGALGGWDGGWDGGDGGDLEQPAWAQPDGGAGGDRRIGRALEECTRPGIGRCLAAAGEWQG